MYDFKFLRDAVITYYINSAIFEFNFSFIIQARVISLCGRNTNLDKKGWIAMISKLNWTNYLAPLKFSLFIYKMEILNKYKEKFYWTLSLRNWLSDYYKKNFKRTFDSSGKLSWNRYKNLTIYYD